MHGRKPMHYNGLLNCHASGLLEQRIAPKPTIGRNLMEALSRRLGESSRYASKKHVTRFSTKYRSTQQMKIGGNSFF